LTRLGEGKTHEGNGRRDHDGGDGPVPVGTMSGDCDLSVSIVDSVAWERMSVSYAI
jgi:hypothetical protein